MFILARLEALGGNPGERFGPLVDPAFGDLVEYQPTFRLIHTRAFFFGLEAPHVAYPPLGALLFVPLYWTRHPIAVYLLLASVLLALMLYLFRRTLIERGIAPWVATLFPACLLLGSFPIEGLLQRGNIELFAFALSALGCWSYWRAGGSDYVASVSWGLAAAIKLYPILFLVLLLSRGKRRAITVGLGAFVMSSLLSLIYLGPDLGSGLAGTLRNIFGYQKARAFEWSAHDLSMNHSFFVLFKWGSSLLRYEHPSLATLYLAGGTLVFGILYAARLRTMPEMNQLIVVSAFVAGLPPTSYFYTLVHLYPAFAVIILETLNADALDRFPPGLRGTLQLFVPIFAAFTLFTFRGIGLYGGPVQALFLLALLVCGLAFPFESSNPSTRVVDPFEQD